MNGIWEHLFPPFDAWWPNIIASIVWSVPALTVHHILLRRHVTRKIVEQTRDDSDQ